MKSFKKVTQKNGLIIEPIQKQLSHSLAWNINIYLLAVSYGRPEYPLNQFGQRKHVLIQLYVLLAKKFQEEWI